MADTDLSCDFVWVNNMKSELFEFHRDLVDLKIAKQILNIQIRVARNLTLG